MKLEIGMYIRTKTGIAKITDIICGQDVKFDNDNIFENDGLKQHHRYDGISTGDYFFKHDVIKISNNIIDLIEEGDYVNGYKIDYINSKCETPFLRSNQPYRVDNTLYSTLVEKGKDYNQPLHFYNEDIKSIVTKEQFESMKYEVK